MSRYTMEINHSNEKPKSPKEVQPVASWAFNDPHDPDHPRNRVNITEEIIDIEENHRHYIDGDKIITSEDSNT